MGAAALRARGASQGGIGGNLHRSRAQNNEWECPEELALRAALGAQSGAELLGLTCRPAGAAPGGAPTVEVASLVRVDPNATPDAEVDAHVGAASVPDELEADDALEGDHTLTVNLNKALALSPAHTPQALGLAAAANGLPQLQARDELEGDWTQALAHALALAQALDLSPAQITHGPDVPAATEAAALQQALAHAPSHAHAPIQAQAHFVTAPALSSNPDPITYPVAPLRRALRQAGVDGSGDSTLRPSNVFNNDKPDEAADRSKVGKSVNPAKGPTSRGVPVRALLPDGVYDDEGFTKPYDYEDYDIDAAPFEDPKPYHLEPHPAGPESYNPNPAQRKGQVQVAAIEKARAQAEIALGTISGQGARSSKGNPTGGSADIDSAAAAPAAQRVPDPSSIGLVHPGNAPLTGSSGDIDPGVSNPAALRDPDRVPIGLVHPGNVPQSSSSGDIDPAASAPAAPRNPDRIPIVLLHPGNAPPTGGSGDIDTAGGVPSSSNPSRVMHPGNTPTEPDQAAAAPPVSHAGWGIHLPREPPGEPKPQQKGSAGAQGPGAESQLAGGSEPDSAAAPPPVSHAGWGIHLPQGSHDGGHDLGEGGGEVDVVAEPYRVVDPSSPAAGLQSRGARVHLPPGHPAGTQTLKGLRWPPQATICARTSK